MFSETHFLNDVSSGDLQLVIRSLSGLTRSTDLFVVAEIDSYGHYFRKVSEGSTWGEGQV